MIKNRKLMWYIVLLFVVMSIVLLVQWDKHIESKEDINTWSTFHHKMTGNQVKQIIVTNTGKEISISPIEVQQIKEELKTASFVKKQTDSVFSIATFIYLKFNDGSQIEIPLLNENESYFAIRSKEAKLNDYVYLFKCASLKEWISHKLKQ